MKVGDLVRFRAERQHEVFGPGLIVKVLDIGKVQVFWHKKGLGRRCGIGSLSRLKAGSK